MKMYRTRSWGLYIEEVEVTRTSESSVWYVFNGRERRESNTYYFETWDKAADSLIEKETIRVRNAEQQLILCKDDLTKAIEFKNKGLNKLH